MDLKPGDPIWFMQTCHGGYGFQRDVPGEFVKVSGPSRVTVRLQTRAGSEVRVVVHPKNVRPRSATKVG